MTDGPYKLPPGWRWVKLGETCEVWDRLRVPVKKKDRTSGAIPYCGANGIIDHVSGFTHEGEFVLLAEDGGFYGPTEVSAYVMAGRFWANNHVHILKGRSGVVVNAFLMYWLVAADLRPFLTGATRPKLTQSSMLNIPIPLAEINEQRRIVARIEAMMGRVREARRLREAAKADADLLMKAALDEVFPRPGSELPVGWRWVRIAEVVDCPRQSLDPRRFPEETFLLYSLPSYDAGDGPERALGSDIGSAKLLVAGGMVLFSKLNPRIPRVWVVEEGESHQKLASTEFLPLAPHPAAVERDFLRFLLLSDSFLAQVKADVLGATGSRQRLKQETVLGAVIPLPPLARQRRIVAHLDAVQEKGKGLRQAQEETDAELWRLEQTILARAFRGEL